MVVGTDDRDTADLVFHALADRTRRGILAEVLVHPVSVSSLARGRPMSFAAVQKHVAVLERAGLVRKHRRGREQLVHGEVEVVRDAMRLLGELERQWRHRLDRFTALLAEPTDTFDTADPSVTRDLSGPVDEADPGGTAGVHDRLDPPPATPAARAEPSRRTDPRGEGARP